MFELNDTNARQAGVRMQWNLRIPLRDGVRLEATLYRPPGPERRTPVLLTLTPYIAQMWHDFALYFAANGYPFLVVNVRGRGDSEGVFRANIDEARNGFDLVEWVAQQPFCNGQVAMWGGSYAGYAQWATAKEFPPHLATIVPVASPYVGLDFPMRGNIGAPYVMRWLTLVSGRASQEKIFGDLPFWRQQFRHWFEAGAAFRELDAYLGNASPTFHEWLSHPQRDAYWDSYNASPAQLAKISLPILTITGTHDGGQLGALTHYREHMKLAPAEARERHYLVIGPWDHSGTRTPREKFCGLTVGRTSLIDVQRLHLEWYAWILRGGPKPAFLKDRVAYYVMGEEAWHYAASLEAVTMRTEAMFLGSRSNPTDLSNAGSLGTDLADCRDADHYLYDPRDLSLARLESTIEADDRTDLRLLHAAAGKHLVYDSKPFTEDAEISGFFELTTWIALDQPDTDIHAAVYEIFPDETGLLLASDAVRARYRESLREERLVETKEPLPYRFERFAFVARRVSKGSRLRLVIGPMNSIHSQRNHNSGRPIAEESMQDARTVCVQLFHDRTYPSALRVPYGRGARTP